MKKPEEVMPFFDRAEVEPPAAAQDFVPGQERPDPLTQASPGEESEREKRPGSARYPDEEATSGFQDPGHFPQSQLVITDVLQGAGVVHQVKTGIGKRQAEEVAPHRGEAGIPVMSEAKDAGVDVEGHGLDHIRLPANEGGAIPRSGARLHYPGPFDGREAGGKVGREASIETVSSRVKETV